MVTNKSGWYWRLSAVILAATIITGAVIIGIRYQPEHAIEITIPPAPNRAGIIYIAGAVANPGLYPFSATDSIQSLLMAAGGIAETANISDIRLYIAATGSAGTQRVDINRANRWLLEALPGIGETLAQRIIEYRQQNGPFYSTAELQKVAGMGTKTYEQIKDLITVRD